MLREPAVGARLGKGTLPGEHSPDIVDQCIMYQYSSSSKSPIDLTFYTSYEVFIERVLLL